jgi:DNA polymerase I
VYAIHTHLGDTPNGAELLRWLDRSDQLLGLDVETTAIDEDKKGQWAPGFAVRTVQLGDTEQAWVIGAKAAYTVLEYAILRRHRFVTHTDYDLRSIQLDLDLDLTAHTVDCHVLACLTRPGEDNGLKTLSKIYAGPELVEAEAMLTERGKELAPVGHRVGPKLKEFIFNELDVHDEAFVTYAGLDAIFVRKVHDALTAEIHDKKMGHLIDREQRWHRMFVRKGIRGTRLDLAKVDEIYGETNAEHEAARERFTLATGLKALSPKRHLWLAEQGADLSSAPPTKGTADKPREEQVPQLTKDTLPMLAAENDTDELRPIWNDMITVSRTKNLRDNLRRMRNSVDANGYGHPVTKTQGAKTGRTSVTGIPLQTFNKEDPRLRSMILADEGNVFVGADFDAVEVRVAAALSGDPILQHILATGADIHDNTARSIWGSKFTKAQRTIGKRATFGTLYGGGAKALAGQVGITRVQAAEVIKRLRNTYPSCFEYLHSLGNYSGVRTPWGRLIPADKDRTYANGNYMIQSTAREILVDAVLRLIDDYRIPEEWVEMCIHDEIILQVPAWAVDYAKAALNAAMNTRFRGVDITAQAELVGPSWGRVEQLEVAA